MYVTHLSEAAGRFVQAVCIMKGEKMGEYYICGIIEESLIDKSILKSIKRYLKKTRIEKVANESPPEWHVNEYHIPADNIKKIISQLEHIVKREWYIHAFSLDSKKLFVIFKDKSFKISLHKDKTWDEMIEYGKRVGCGPEWTENIPLRV